MLIVGVVPGITKLEAEDMQNSFRELLPGVEIRLVVGMMGAIRIETDETIEVTGGNGAYL
jgi:hypothetical protein